MTPRTRDRTRSGREPDRHRSGRRPGRPRRGVLTREHILDTALRMLERDGAAALTIRAVARELGVDAMALYHYVTDKDDLLRAAAALAYDRLDDRAGTRGDGRQRLETLALAYLGLLGRAGELLRYLTAGNAATREAQTRFAARFATAIAPLGLPARRVRACHDAYVDFLHGFSLAVTGGRVSAGLRRRLRAELEVLWLGMEALARRT